MERRVYKYELPVGDHSFIVMPVGAKILSVHEQREAIYVWALVDPTEARTAKRSFRIAGTGHSIEYDDRFVFVGSVFLENATLVFHVFEFKH
jgi:hypothetical protein